MRILHVSASYLPAHRYGGTIVSVHGLCRALAARGHDVHVFTTSVDGPSDSAVPHGTPVELDGVKVWYFRSRHLRRLYWAPAMGNALARHVSGFAVVHTHALFLWPLWAAARAARALGVPYVVSPRGMLERELMRRKSRIKKALWVTLIERRNLERAAAVHVTSHREHVKAAEFGFHLPAVFEVPNGVEVPPDSISASSPAAIPASQPYVLCLGRLSWKKGLDRLIAALPYATAARVVIAGNDEEQLRPELEAQATALRVRNRITFTGPVAPLDKWSLLRHAQVLVVPSYSENFGNVVVEAMAVGCPVIVTPEVGLAEVVRQSGAGWVLDGAPRELGEGLSRLISDPALRKRMGASGRETVDRLFGWGHVAKQMETLYQRVTA